jgi:YVTN family beta-propeller protein
MKAFLLRFFTWWNGQTFGTQLWTSLYGELVGEDDFGNRYFQERKVGSSADGKLIYVANEDDNMVTVIDVERRTMVTEIPVGVEPEGMGVSHDGKWIVNTSETTNMAHFIDADTLEIVDNILVDQRPRFAEWTSDDAEIWVSSEIGGTVSVIDNELREIKH